MFAEGIFPIGDGLLDIDEERLKGLLVPHDINEIYDVEQTPFARGKFAAVRRAIHKNSGTHFAAKFLKRRRRAQSSDREIKHEIAVLMLCSEAENIVKLNAVHESRSDTALLLELATGGELQTFLDNEECLNEGQARMCMREVLKALQFLHKRSIVHLDLKPQNILLTGERIEDGLKLCDFGISRVVAEGTNVREIVGTPDYVAPEVLQYEPLSLCTDIWSVGVLTYVLLSGFSPFGGETKQETFLNISQCALTFPDKLFGGVSSAAIDFIRKALRIKPSDRMTAAGCLEHIWLKDECNIDRHIFNKLSTKQQLEQADNNHQEDDNDEDDNNEQENEEDIAEVSVNDDDNNDDDDRGVEDNEVEIVKDKPQAISVDNSEEEDNITSTSASNNCLNGHSTSKHYNNHLNGLANGHTNGVTNGHTNGHSNVVANGHSNGVANGHSNSVISSYSNGFTNALPLDYSIDFLNGHSNGHSPGHLSCLTKAHSNGFATNKTLSDDFKDKKSSIATATTTTTKTTAVHNVAATKAITIPLCSVQPLSFQQTPPQEQHSQHQQQQLIHIPARRHSSESNKENTFLTTKKIQATSNNNGLNLKKPASSSLNDSVTQSSTATIVITPTACTNASNIVATITLPCSASSSSNGGLNEKLINTAHQHSLFPDAPTTPKVIRKASPNSDTSPTSVKALVKKFQLEGGEQPITPPEFATNGSKQQPQHIQLNQCQIIAAASTLDTKSTNKYNKGRPSLSPPTLAHSSAMTIANTTARRASEPMPAIHTTKKLSIISTSAPVSIPPATTNNFKTTCVYCKSCTNSFSLTNGCRHPSSCTNNSSSSTTTAAVIHNNATKSLSTATTPLSGNSTKSLINNSSSNGSLTSTSGASTNGTTTNANGTTALLFGQHHNHQHLLNSHHNSHHSHHHHHHHHLHHHGVVKSAATSANGLSLDQGIIC